MGYNYSPTYYSSFQDTLSSLYKSIILPFSLKNLRLPDQNIAKRQSDNLKWQQDSFHRILHLIALHNEGIVSTHDVAAFRSHLLDTLIASPADPDPPALTRDKLLFLKELLSAKCISAEEYHSSKRPLLQKLAVQGVEIDCRDVVVGAPAMKDPVEEWSVIDLDDKENPNEREAVKHRSPGIKSLIGKSWKAKRRPFTALFHKEQCSENINTSSKKQWGLDGFKKWKKGSSEEEASTTYLPQGDRLVDVSSSSATCTLVNSPIGEGPDTKRIKNKIHSDGSASDFFIDKVLGENIKKELSKIQSELSSTNPNLNFSDEQIEAISTRLPVDKADLKKFFPRSWCDRYGDVVLDVVKKEFKGHVGEMETLRNAARERQGEALEGNEENFHPNLFSINSRSK